jgi:hypothetical protein
MLISSKIIYLNTSLITVNCKIICHSRFIPAKCLVFLNRQMSTRCLSTYFYQQLSANVPFGRVSQNPSFKFIIHLDCITAENIVYIKLEVFTVCQ